MKEVKEDWYSIYRGKKINIKKEIEEINFFGDNIAKVLLECFKPGNVILEAGCGTGRFCFWLEEVRKVKVEALVDTGATFPALPEDMVMGLALPSLGEHPAETAEGAGKVRLAANAIIGVEDRICLLYTSPSPRDS